MAAIGSGDPFPESDVQVIVELCTDRKSFIEDGVIVTVTEPWYASHPYKEIPPLENINMAKGPSGEEQECFVIFLSKNPDCKDETWFEERIGKAVMAKSASLYNGSMIITDLHHAMYLARYSQQYQHYRFSDD